MWKKGGGRNVEEGRRERGGRGVEGRREGGERGGYIEERGRREKEEGGRRLRKQIKI